MAVVALLTAVAAPTAMAARNEVNLIPLVADNCLPSGSSCSMWFGESCCKGFCIPVSMKLAPVFVAFVVVGRHVVFCGINLS
ncbi:hypothetical protein V6N13_117308 [Hibiscus sabdariffa]